jgi:hypothetical protein
MKLGSVVLTTLIIMTALIVIVHSALRSSSYLMLLAREREIYEQKTQKTTVQKHFSYNPLFSMVFF